MKPMKIRIFVISLFLTAGLLQSAFYPPLTRAEEDDKELFLVAQKAFEDGFYDVSMRYLNQLLSDYPQSDKKPQAKLLLGQCYFFQSQYLKAYDTFQEILSYPEFKDATLYWLGETYLKGSDYAQAEKHYRQLIDGYPNSVYTPQAYYSLGWLYFDQNDYQKSQEAFQSLITRFPTHQLNEDAAFKLGETEFNLHHYEKAISYYQKFVLTYPQSTRHAESYFYTGECYYYLEDFINAVAYYAKAADITYDNKLTLMAKVSMGWSYLKLEKYDLAQKYFDEALEFSKEKNILSDEIFLGQASLYMETQEFLKALETYDQLIANFPNSKRVIEAYLGKANCHYQLNNFTEAISAYQKTIDQFQSDASNQEIIDKASFGLAWAQLKSGQINQSIETFEAIKDKAESKTIKISALVQIADAYQDIEQFDKALEVYDKILRDYPDNAYADYIQFRQGVILLKLNKTEAATLSFQSLQANFQKSKYLNDARYYLALTYFKKEDWKTAKEKIQDFISKQDDKKEYMAEAHYILGLSNFNLKDYPEALQTFQKIIKNFPEQFNMVRNSELNIAKCLYNTKKIDEALQNFKSIINKYPESEAAQESLLWIGDHYMRTLDVDTAIAYYQEFIQKFPNAEKIYVANFALGRAYQEKGLYEQAINTYKQVASPDDTELNTNAQLAIADIFSKELNPQLALQTYENILITSPEFKRDAYLKIAGVYNKSKEYEKCIVAYKKALQADGGLSKIKDAELQFYIADSYELLNQSKQAVEEYLKIPYLYAQDVSWVVKAYLRVARIFEDEEKWEEAQTIYNKVVALNTDEVKFAQERLQFIEQGRKNKK